MNHEVVALIPAAGRGERAGEGVPKQFRALAGRSVLELSLEAAMADTRVAAAVLVLPPETKLSTDIAADKVGVCTGGNSRAESVRRGLAAIGERFNNCSHVLVHDAARPCLHPQDLAAVLEAGLADEHGAILARRVAETVKRGDERIETTVDRDGLWLAQTPQMFRFDLLRAALAKAGEVTDEAAAMEQAGYRPRLVATRYPNPKITWPEDFALAQLVLANHVENR